MLNKLYTLQYKKSREDGFSLIELMIVVVIIGILAAIAIPIFANQQAEAMKSTLKSDLKNAATVMHTEAAKNKGRFSPWIPSYSAQSANNQVRLDQSKSNQEAFCLVGTNTKLSGVTFYYSSGGGGLSTTACPEVADAGSSAPSFQAGRAGQLDDRSVLIVHSTRPTETPRVPGIVSELRSYGFGTVDTVSGDNFPSMSDAAVAEYDMLFLFYWEIGAPSGVRAKAEVYYNGGGKIFQDGNDTTATGNPFITSDVSIISDGSYDPTYNQGLSPSFPYTFPETAWSGDSWNCPTAINSNAVSIATTYQQGRTCHTIIGANNSSDGRWVYISQFNSINGPVAAILEWLNA